MKVLSNIETELCVKACGHFNHLFLDQNPCFPLPHGDHGAHGHDHRHDGHDDHGDHDVCDASCVYGAQNGDGHDPHGRGVHCRSHLPHAPSPLPPFPGLSPSVMCNVKDNAVAPKKDRREIESHGPLRAIKTNK